MNLLDEFEKRVICGDGAMGTYLLELGEATHTCFEELCVSKPERVLDIHSAYLGAGAQVIETNSFAANRLKLGRYGFGDRVHEINWQAAQLAKQAAKNHNALVAGSVGPLGITAEEAIARGIDRKDLFREHIGTLLDGRVDFIILETFEDLDELLLALLVKQELHHCPVLASLAVPSSGRLPCGTALPDAFKKLISADADILGLNCINGPHGMVTLLESIAVDHPLAVFPNAGRPRYHEGRYIYETDPAYFAETAERLINLGVGMIGGCCGTTPKHIAALSSAIHGRKPVSRGVKIELTPEKPRPPLPAEPSILDRIAEGKTVIVTELDPPKTLILDRYYTAARALTHAGSDTITLADNSLAILRVSNLAIGAELKHQGITPLLHISCRDRNALGLQSELMGMAALGIRHVLPLTGDPAKVGDHPGAKSVYDMTSIQLIETIRRLNEGFTQSGTDIKRLPGFIIGCTFNPNARNLDAQVSRLERKVAAGAQYVMTQPVFDPALVAETARRTAHLNVPVLVGVWPLLNGRQAKFLHNEVPGIVIPDNIMDRMAGLEGLEGRNQGVEIGKEITRAVLDHFPGIYLITPFQAYETTADLAAYVRGRS